MIAKWKRDALRWYRLDTIYFSDMYREVREHIGSDCYVNECNANCLLFDRIVVLTLAVLHRL